MILGPSNQRERHAPQVWKVRKTAAMAGVAPPLIFPRSSEIDEHTAGIVVVVVCFSCVFFSVSLCSCCNEILSALVAPVVFLLQLLVVLSSLNRCETG